MKNRNIFFASTLGPISWRFRYYKRSPQTKKPTYPEASAGKGGEGGIRTLGTGLSPYDGLANRWFQPLIHLTGWIWKGSIVFMTVGIAAIYAYPLVPLIAIVQSKGIGRSNTAIISKSHLSFVANLGITSPLKDSSRSLTKKELMLFSGFGGETLLPKGKANSQWNYHPSSV